MQIPGYEGICRECFCPVLNGLGTRLHEGGLLFHAECIEAHPDGYYIEQERQLAAQSSNKLQEVL